MKDINDWAQKYLAEALEEGDPLAYHAGSWWEYSGTHYEEVSPEWVESTVRMWLTGKGIDVKPAHVANLTAQVRAYATVDRRLQMPGWIKDEQVLPAPIGVVPFRNGLLDVERFLEGKTVLLPHSPAWFSSNCLPYDYDPAAACPAIDQYLREVLADDEQIGLAEEWAGYSLTHDNRYQKLLFLLGTKRSGKTTMLELLTKLVGEANVFGGSLQSLAGEFGLASLVGKQLLTTSEMHLAGQDGKRAVQVLKNLTGGDRVAVNRKGRDIVSMVLPVRIVLAANQLPRLPDDSNALAARMLVLHFPNSYLGKEDYGLGARLAAELPGLANKALLALRRLHERGRFVQPERGQGFLADFENLSAPVEEFLADYCEEGPDRWESTENLYWAWVEFCGLAGHESGARNGFGAKLAAARPAVRNAVRRKPGGGRERCYKGIGLAEPDGLKLLGRRLGPLGLTARRNARGGLADARVALAEVLQAAEDAPAVVA
jgi:putative DNA primase/helicase